VTPLYTMVARAVDETGGFLSETCGDHNMHSGDVALRFSIVFAVAGFITMAAGVYEIDRREKSSSETVTANLTETEQRVRTLSDQIRVLNDQHTRQINANARELQALGIQIQTLESRLNELEDHLRVRRESAPGRR
jgi:septal ring factor EnvC (AmiA/AmiB activator)